MTSLAGAVFLLGVRSLGYGVQPGATPQILDGTHDISTALAWRSRYTDPTGFYYLGTRYYDPASGTFLSCDPLGHAASMDLYSYCGGDPINGYDPDGRFGKHVAQTTIDDFNADSDAAARGEHVVYNYGQEAVNASTYSTSPQDQVRIAGIMQRITENEPGSNPNTAAGSIPFAIERVLAQSSFFAAHNQEFLQNTQGGVTTLAAATPIGLEGKVATETLLEKFESKALIADDTAILKSIRRYSERLVQGKVISSNPATTLRVRSIQASIANGDYNVAGTRFHSLNFQMVRYAQSLDFLLNLNIDQPILTPGGFLSSRRPDYLFTGGGIYGLKPWRPSAGAYDSTEQFQDIQGATGIKPIPLYYKLW